MRKQIIITIILLLATAYVTVVYFKNLNPPGVLTSNVMQTIPKSASLIFEFNNDKSFYDIFNGNKLFLAIIGKQSLDDLDTIQQELLLNPLLKKYFTGQNIFISVHPVNANDAGLLLTIPAAKGFDFSVPGQLNKQTNSGLLVTPLLPGLKNGYTIFIKSIKKRFYVAFNEENILSGSFSKQLITEFLNYKNQKNGQEFTLLSEKQNANSLASLYVNFKQLSPLFYQFFKNKKTDIFGCFREFPGLASLSLNYRSDALMFNGATNFGTDKPSGYLTLFARQQPVVNHLKDILPSTTAYSTSFAVSDPEKFETDLSALQVNIGEKDTVEQLFNKIKAETGVKIRQEFTRLLGNEFAFVTTRYLEKYALISIIDGSRLKLLLGNISKMEDENSGILNYDKLPLFLLGDAFGYFRHPYFIIIDNYLILANTPGELKSYKEMYVNRKFLSKSENYNQFDNLLAERSNVAFLFSFKNSMQILKRDMFSDIYTEIEKDEPGWKDFFFASCQLTASDKNFYTNFCLQLNKDTTNINPVQ